MTPPSVVSSLLVVIILLSLGGATSTAAATGGGGRWDILKRSTGVSAMHMQLLNNDRVVFFDRTDFGKSNLSLPDGRCRNDSRDQALQVDCTAHAAEYDVASNSVRALMVLTDTWCSSGTVDPDGRLIQTGGFNDGERAVRIFRPCSDCDWAENQSALAVRRWYATNQILPDGSAVIIGGRRQFNYEFYPKSAAAGTFALPFLRLTRDPEENNLYPFVHMNVDGNLFVFANNRAVLLDYKKNAVVKTFPQMPGGDPRNYPSTGSSVLLPLKPSGEEAEVLICGGAPMGSYNEALNKGNFSRALDTCGRIKITDRSPSWSVETMPMPRVMGDMIMLPNGEVLLINGAGSGTAGWELGRDPVLLPVVYRPDNPLGSRFEVQNPTAIPRLYHSSAVLLRDGRVLVGGSNPHAYYNFTGVMYPTETSLEAFSPDYLSPAAGNSSSRPEIVLSKESPSPFKLSYGKPFVMCFSLARGSLSESGVTVAMVAPSFTTHSYSMNQRLLMLETAKAAGSGSPPTYEVEAVAPRSAAMAPPGYYMLFVIKDRIPSEGVWVHIQ